jgi:hypothetical protein
MPAIVLAPDNPQQHPGDEATSVLDHDPNVASNTANRVPNSDLRRKAQLATDTITGWLTWQELARQTEELAREYAEELAYHSAATSTTHDRPAATTARTKPDVTGLKRQLGITPWPADARRGTQPHTGDRIRSDLAVGVVRALGYDPVDFDL